MMRTNWETSTLLILFAAIFVLMIAPRALGGSCDEPFPVPIYQKGDKWRWKDEKGREWVNQVVRLEGEFILIEWPSGAIAYHDKDWVVRQVKKKNGEIVSAPAAGYPDIGKKVLDFPLRVGNRWQTMYSTQSVAGDVRNYSEYFDIAKCEEITTPAGSFPAFRVEVTQRTEGFSGEYYLWYAPQARHFIRKQYKPSNFWRVGSHLDHELIQLELR
jgi:hypothetical protein